MSATTASDRLDEATLGLAVAGSNLRPGTLRDQLDPSGTLVVFLRHLGCPFCRQCVTEIREASRRGPMPPTLFVHPATVAEGEAFFRKAAPESRAVADPDARLYEGFGLVRGGVGSLLNASVIACGIRALVAGHGGGRIQGDPWRMPGFFLIRDGAIAWEHRARHAADHPDFTHLPDDLAALA
jgi:hypothetical protein